MKVTLKFPENNVVATYEILEVAGRFVIVSTFSNIGSSTFVRDTFREAVEFVVGGVSYATNSGWVITGMS